MPNAYKNIIIINDGMKAEKEHISINFPPLILKPRHIQMNCDGNNPGIKGKKNMFFTELYSRQKGKCKDFV